MPNIAAILKSEIVRLSKKTARSQMAPVRSAATTHRHQIAALKKKIDALERDIARLRRAAPSRAAEKEDSDAPGGRFVAKGLVSLRNKLGLSAEEFGQLVGVSGNTIYNWEHRKTRPRASQMPALMALRGVGKREARARLAELQ